MNEKFLSELSARLAELAAANPAQDLERNFRAMLSGALTRLDLVSREEYDVQLQVLVRARKSSPRSKRAWPSSRGGTRRARSPAEHTRVLPDPAGTAAIRAGGRA